jgi:hypothetical protein
MTAYKLTATGVQRLSDGAWIPADPRNGDYQEYQKWANAGNIPDPADVPAPGPAPSITTDQLIAVLSQKGLLTLADLKSDVIAADVAANPIPIQTVKGS